MGRHDSLSTFPEAANEELLKSDCNKNLIITNVNFDQYKIKLNNSFSLNPSYDWQQVIIIPSRGKFKNIIFAECFTGDRADHIGLYADSKQYY